MLSPSRPLVMFLVLIAVVALVLGLATDVGLFGWSLAVLLALYLGVAGFAQRTRRRNDTAGRAA
jgi:membrane protein implicated in regulation of membrane protease activity